MYKKKMKVKLAIIMAVVSLSAPVYSQGLKYSHVEKECARKGDVDPYSSVFVVMRENLVVPGRVYDIDELFKYRFDTLIISNHVEYVAELYKLFCTGDYSASDINGFEKANNFIGVFFSKHIIDIANIDEHHFDEVFSISDSIVYAGAGNRMRTVDDAFVGRLTLTNGGHDVIGYQ